MTITTNGHNGLPTMIVDSRHVDLDDDFDTSITFNDAESFGEIIRGHFPGLLDIASDGEVQQVSDQDLVIFNGYGFRVTLDNGASFDIQIAQRDYAADDDEEGTTR